MRGLISKRRRLIVAVVAAVIGLAACPGDPAATAGSGPGDGGGNPALTVAEQLQALSSRSIYFGHQSVGGNVMQGVTVLLDANSGPEPTIYYPAIDASRVTAGVWAHQYVGTNGDPLGKIAAFEAALNGGMGAKVNIAFLKFCYADFWDAVAYWSTHTPADLFAEYQAAIARLQVAYPTIRFVHVTVPLWTATETNARREAFSNLVRSAYGQAVFDIAKIESTDPQGNAVTGPGGVRALYPGYTSDGGHLNATGQEVVARALVAHLAAPQ